MVRTEQDEFLEMLTAELSDPKYQEEIRQVVTKRPEVYREKVEAQELGGRGIRKTEGGYKKGSQPASQSEVDAALNDADKRMLRESPMLIQHKLIFKGGLLLPDHEAHKREEGK